MNNARLRLDAAERGGGGGGEEGEGGLELGQVHPSEESSVQTGSGIRRGNVDCRGN